MPQCDKLRTRRLANVTIACGREAQRDHALALGIPRFTTEENEVLGSDDVDLVLVLTSMPEHARLAGAALRAGKHVLVEKPLATNLSDARNLLGLERAARLERSRVIISNGGDDAGQSFRR